MDILQNTFETIVARCLGNNTTIETPKSLAVVTCNSIMFANSNNEVW